MAPPRRAWYGAISTRLVVADRHIQQAQIALVVDGTTAFGTLGIILENFGAFQLHVAAIVDGTATAAIIVELILSGQLGRNSGLIDPVVVKFTVTNNGMVSSLPP